MNIRIILSVFLAFGIAFSILFAVQYNIWNEHFIDQEDELFIQTIQEINSKFDLQEKKVFILGSSQAKQLNITHIHEIVGCGGAFSMPSNHAVNPGAAVGFLVVLYPSLGWVLWPVMVLIGLSRVYLGAHYVTDVLVGWAMGLALGAGVAFLVKTKLFHDRTKES